MEGLPAELQILICSYVPRVDLRTLTRTCSSLAAAARPRLFETLTFHGDDKISPQHMLLRAVHDEYRPASTSPVDLVSLEDAIDKVTGLGIEKYAKTFQYSPKLYMNNFWPRYRDWVEDRMDAELSESSFSDGQSDDCDSEEEEHGYVDYQRERENRRARPDKERDVIATAELYWAAKLNEQEKKKETNHAALVRLFRNMPNLESLQILEWSCTRELRKHGITDKIDTRVKTQFSEFDILNTHLETLGSALQDAGVRIKHLLLPSVLGRAIVTTAPVQYLFGALTSLSLNLWDPIEMCANYDGPPPSLRTLFRCARDTLEHLKFSNTYCVHHQLPNPGEHLLEKLWGDDPTQDGHVFVFPRLKLVQFTTIILYTPSLQRFLEAQPSLESAVFTSVALATPGYSWPDVAAALPPSCQYLRIDECKGMPTPKVIPTPPPDLGVAFNQIKRLTPNESVFPPSCGWRIGATVIQEEAEDMAYEQLDVVKEQLVADIYAARNGHRTSTEMGLEELLELRGHIEHNTATNVSMLRKGYCILERVEFERI